jgi:hypothetical protein
VKRLAVDRRDDVHRSKAGVRGGTVRHDHAHDEPLRAGVRMNRETESRYPGRSGAAISKKRLSSMFICSRPL